MQCNRLLIAAWHLRNAWSYFAAKIECTALCRAVVWFMARRIPSSAISPMPTSERPLLWARKQLHWSARRFLNKWSWSMSAFVSLSCCSMSIGTCFLIWKIALQKWILIEIQSATLYSWILLLWKLHICAYMYASRTAEYSGAGRLLQRYYWAHLFIFMELKSGTGCKTSMCLQVCG